MPRRTTHRPTGPKAWLLSTAWMLGLVAPAHAADPAPAPAAPPAPPAAAAPAPAAAPIDVPATRGTVDLSGFQAAIQQARPPALKPDMVGEQPSAPPTGKPHDAAKTPPTTEPLLPSGKRPRTVAEWAAYKKAQEQTQGQPAGRAPQPPQQPQVQHLHPPAVAAPAPVAPVPPTPPAAAKALPAAVAPQPALHAEPPPPPKPTGKPVAALPRPSPNGPTEDEKLQQVAEKLLSAIAEVNEKQRREAAAKKPPPKADAPKPKRSATPDAGLDPSTETLVAPQKQ